MKTLILLCVLSMFALTTANSADASETPKYFANTIELKFQTSNEDMTVLLTSREQKRFYWNRTLQRQSDADYLITVFHGDEKHVFPEDCLAGIKLDPSSIVAGSIATGFDVSAKGAHRQSGETVAVSITIVNDDPLCLLSDGKLDELSGK